MTTFADFRTRLARELRDPDAKTFDTDDLSDMVNDALTEVGRIAPQEFQEDIAPVADTLTYALRSDDFPSGVYGIELTRVELWDTTYTPHRAVKRLRPADGEYVSFSQTGWKVWNGQLELTNLMEDYIDPDVHLIRVWGYGPYVLMVADDDVLPVNAELERAISSYCRVQALRRLSLERDLFTQWQTRSGNSDVSPAGLMNALAQAEEDWRRRERKLMALRELA